MSYAVVFWVDENKYSVVSEKKIQVPPEKKLTDVVGTILPVKWSKGNVYDATIKAVGRFR